MHFYKFRNTNPWNDGSERTGTLEMMTRCLPVCLLACMLLHHNSRANEAWSHLFSAWMRITPTLLGIWSHADGYHYLRGFGCCTACRCLSQRQDVWASLHTHAIRCKTVTKPYQVCAAAHTRTQQTSKNVVNLCGNRVKSVIKAIFCDGRLKMGSAGTSAPMIRANTGRWLPNTSILHVHNIFGDLFFPLTGDFRSSQKPNTNFTNSVV